MPWRPKDRSADADRVYFERLRAMSPIQRAEISTALTFAVEDLALKGLRRAYPDDSDDELRLRLAGWRLGDELVKRIWGWPADQP